MIIRKNDKNNDWTFGYSETEYLSDSDAVTLDINTKLQEWKNNCFWAMNNGIPYDIRLGYKGQKNLLDEDVKQIVLNNQFVLSLNSFSSTLNEEREYKADFSYTDIYSNNEQTSNFLINMGVLYNA